MPNLFSDSLNLLSFLRVKNSFAPCKTADKLWHPLPQLFKRIQRLISSLRLWLWPTYRVTVIWPIGLHVDSIKAFPSAGTAVLDESTSIAGGIVFQFCQNRQLCLLRRVLQIRTWWIYCTTCIPCVRFWVLWISNFHLDGRKVALQTDWHMGRVYVSFSKALCLFSCSLYGPFVAW